VGIVPKANGHILGRNFLPVDGWPKPEGCVPKANDYFLGKK
jgi:hypothetical protein